MPSIYLAGPDVFRADARAEGERLKALCAAEGLTGLYPLDGAHASPGAADIRARCIADIDACTVVVANISPFRGPHMDPGTAWELGYAEARGKPIFLWSGARATMRERIVGTRAGDELRDTDGHLVEDFGACENLMITLADTDVYDSADAAIKAAGAYLRPPAVPASRPQFGLFQMIGIAAAAALLAGWLGDKFLFR